jgi:hypothetical protein
MHTDTNETMQQVLELCVSQLSCVDLAAVSSSSRCLQAVVQALARSSIASHLLCRSVRDAALHGKQHEQAVKWLCELEGFDAPNVLRGTADLLLATPLVPKEIAAVLAALLLSAGG